MKGRGRAPEPTASNLLSTAPYRTLARHTRRQVEHDRSSRDRHRSVKGMFGDLPQSLAVDLPAAQHEEPASPCPLTSAPREKRAALARLTHGTFILGNQPPASPISTSPDWHRVRPGPTTRWGTDCPWGGRRTYGPVGPHVQLAEVDFTPPPCLPEAPGNHTISGLEPVAVANRDCARR